MALYMYCTRCLIYVYNVISSGSLSLTGVRIGPPTGNCFTMEHFQILDTQLRVSDLENVADDPDREPRSEKFGCDFKTAFINRCSASVGGGDDTPGDVIVDTDFNDGDGDDVTTTVTDPETGDETDVSSPREPNGPDATNSTLELPSGGDTGGSTTIDDGTVTFPDVDTPTLGDVTTGFHMRVGQSNATNTTRTRVFSLGLLDGDSDESTLDVRTQLRIINTFRSVIELQD